MKNEKNNVVLKLAAVGMVLNLNCMMYTMDLLSAYRIAASVAKSKIGTAGILNFDLRFAREPLMQIYEPVATSEKEKYFKNELDCATTAITLEKISHRAKLQALADKKGTKNITEDRIDPVVYPNLAKFVKKFHCSFGDEMQARLVMNYQQCNGKTRVEHGHCEFQGGPTIFTKGESIERIINAERMKKVFEQNKLDCLRVPDKYIFDEGAFLCVVASKVHFGDQRKKITLKEIQQLVKLSFETGYRDWQFGDNVKRDIDGKLVFVDTEDMSYAGRTYMKPGVSKSSLFFGIIGRHSGLLENVDEDAKAWLKMKKDSMVSERQFWSLIKHNLLLVDQYKKRDACFANLDIQFFNDMNFFTSVKNRYRDIFDETPEEVKSLSYNSQYDADIDFEQVKEKSWRLSFSQWDYKED